ncbi:hypothetical protein DASC09_048240 [Saccharomycopsis crataegensis]|uniref:Dynein intermediate chain n=1 Tax=Saccharomycopsis crataegensis TaxID=43959 RepID=A0AAV5QSP8_9ASCO|nr:hypothetical protein DASC09_048240 [Saccharomycopsis crataegensis]
MINNNINIEYRRYSWNKNNLAIIMPISRREEIEAKRQKLQALRKQRQDRESRDKLQQQQQQQFTSPTRSVSGVGAPTNKDNVNKLVDELLVTHSPKRLSQLSTDRNGFDTPSVESSFTSDEPELKGKKVEYVDIGIQTEPIMKSWRNNMGGNLRHVETITYDKAVQTLDFQIRKEQDLEIKRREWEQRVRNELEAEHLAREEQVSKNLKELQEKYENSQSFKNEKIRQAITELEDEDEQQESDMFSLRKFTDQIDAQEKLKDDAMKETKLKSFFSQSFKLINQVLAEDNYAEIDDNTNTDNTENSEKSVTVNKSLTTFKSEDSKVAIKQHRILYNGSFCAGRSVNSIDWASADEQFIVVAYSPKKEIFTAAVRSVNENTNDILDFGLDDDKSLIAIWDLNQHTNIPTHFFTASTEILSVIFNKKNPHIIYGGGYNGKLYMWDTRHNTKDPVATSSLNSGRGFRHLYPVYSLQHRFKTIAGDNESGMLVSASTDGTVCSWSPFSLQTPLTVPVHLKSPPGLLAKYDELAPLAVDIVNNDPKNGLLVACEDGRIYRVENWNTLIASGPSAQNSAVVDSKNIYEGHIKSPVTSIDCHPSSESKLGNLFLTCGFDWNIKLWKYSTAGSLDTTLTNRKIRKSTNSWLGSDNSDMFSDITGREFDTSSLVETIPPLLELNRDDSVMDVQWRPRASSQFMSVGGAGKLEYWDLLKDTVSPIIEAVPNNNLELSNDEADSNPKRHDGALTRLSFNYDGSMVVTGGTNGFLTIFIIDEECDLDSKTIDDRLVAMLF